MPRLSWFMIAALLGTANLSTSVASAATPTSAKSGPGAWIHRWAPERNTLEIGGFGGSFFPSLVHDLYDPKSGYKPLWLANPEGGLRLAYFPERYLGVELEGVFIAARVRTLTNDPATPWGARGHLIVQLPWWSVTPFVLVGAGALGVGSEPNVLGQDIDPAIHWGGGVEVRLHRRVGLRLDGRQVFSARHAAQRSFASHVEVLGGLVLVLHSPH